MSVVNLLVVIVAADSTTAATKTGDPSKQQNNKKKKFDMADAALALTSENGDVIIKTRPDKKCNIM